MRSLCCVQFGKTSESLNLLFHRLADLCNNRLSNLSFDLGTTRPITNLAHSKLGKEVMKTKGVHGV